MSHIQYTIYRSGRYYYNRRVPKHAVESYGPFIRHSLSNDPAEAEAYSKRLSDVLDGSWNNRSCISAVDVASVVEGFKPRSVLLSQIAEEYLALRKINQTPSRVALSTFISLAGDRDVSDYTREDARLFVSHLTLKGNKTATIRRRLNSLSAILNYAYAELDLEKRNPFSRLFIQGEGDDGLRRGVFTNAQLKQGYEKALTSGSTVKLILPLLGETGCRLAEIVGLRHDDIDMERSLIHVRPNNARRLKTKNSERLIPQVGYGKLAMEAAIRRSDGEWLFPQYIKDEKCYATHASNALNKWLKRDFEGLTAHCLRHTMRDRLRAVECPLDMIDQLCGWSSVGGIGVSYGRGYAVDQMRSWMEKVNIE